MAAFVSRNRYLDHDDGLDFCGIGLVCPIDHWLCPRLPYLLVIATIGVGEFNE